MNTEHFADLNTALDSVLDPEVLRPITELGMVRQARVDADGTAHISLALTIVGCPAASQIESNTREAASRTQGVTAVDVQMGVMSAEERAAFRNTVRASRPERTNPFTSDSLTRIIAITSGKGGVGKSTITANLAAIWAEAGLRVGVVDADVFGFSIPALFGLVNDGVIASPSRVDDLILPPVAFGVKVISIGMFLGDADQRETTVSWRGPMLHRTIEQFLTDVWFGDLDVLLIDMPPGTGDVAISVGQLLPHAEVVVVTTPQPTASHVAVRSALVARQTGQHVVGVIENMSTMTLDDHTKLEVFGAGGGTEVAERLSVAESEQVPLLGSVPLSPAFREVTDQGQPAAVVQPANVASVALRDIAEKLLPRSHSLSGSRLPITPVS